MITQPRSFSFDYSEQDLLNCSLGDLNDLWNKTIDAAKKGLIEKVRQVFPNLGGYSFNEIVDIFRQNGVVVVVDETIGGRLVVSSSDISSEMWNSIESVPPKQ